MILFSDLHLFGKENRSISVAPESVHHLFGLLQHYHAKGYALYGLGDILEGWRFRPRQILKLHPDFSWFIIRHVTIIRGNHDWDVWKKIERTFDKRTYEFLTIGPFFFSHGHELDPLNRRHAWYSKYATKFSGVLKRLGLDTDRAKNRMRERHADYIKKIYRRHAARLAATIAPDAHVFCFGHIHMPYIDTTDPAHVVVNLGSIASHLRAYSYAEVTAREITLWKIEL
ncbi:metallophosphoesterase family protein [Candidatus Berkelbacteria bacterium]|nr:metallophosphoesterase family protein [Candidatus Berkelbacteria bacterium]